MSQPNAPPPEPPNTETQRVGGYEILGQIGRGGMGAVFKARQLSVGRIVALKILPPTLSQNEAFRQRFLREARAAAQLSHPNIVQAIDAGKAGLYYHFAMEFVDGASAQAQIKAAGAMSERRALEIARDIARALDHAHQAGFVHRDVKPDNILITSDGTAKLADLGLARETAAIDSRVTQPGVALGTPGYISPEQAAGEQELDGRTDLYSLGATLYGLLTGSPPYAGASAVEIMYQHMHAPPPDPARAGVPVSPATAVVIRRAMAKSREQRYASAAMMLADIERALAAPAAPVVRPRPAPPRRRPRRTSRTGLYAGLGVAACAALAVGVALWHGLGRKPGDARPAPVEAKPERLPQPPAPPDKAGLEELRRWVAAHPDRDREGIARYVAFLRTVTDGNVKEDAEADLAARRAEQQRAADALLTELTRRAEALAGAGDFDRALEVYAELPDEFANLLAERAKAAARALTARADRAVQSGVANVRARLAADRPDDAAAELLRLARIRYALRAREVARLRSEIARKRQDLARIRPADRAGALAAVGKLLREIEGAAASGDLAAAGRLADAALKDDTMKPAAAERRPVVAVGKALAEIARTEREQLVNGLRKRIGRRVTLDTLSGPKTGTVKAVTKEHVVLDRSYQIGGKTYTRPDETVRLDSLGEQTRRRFVTGWVPRTKDDHIASAILALGKMDAAAFEAALDGAKGHRLHDRYAAKLRDVRLGAAESAATRTWESELEPYTRRPKLTPGEAAAAGKALDAFEEKHGRTRFAATVQKPIAALRQKIAPHLPHVRFDSGLKLQVSVVGELADGSLGLKVVGSTPTGDRRGVKLRRDSLWVVGPSPEDAAAFGDKALRALVRDLERKSVPGLDLVPGGRACGGLSDAGLAVLRRLGGLQFLRLGGGKLGEASFKYVASLGGLTHLVVLRSEIRDAALVQITRLPQLRYLDLERNSRTFGEGLGDLKRLSRLEGLHLGDGVDDRGAGRLPPLPRLRFLQLGSRIMDGGLANLAALPRLESLRIDNSRRQSKGVSDHGLLCLKKHPRLRTLVLVSCRGVSDAGLRALKDAAPRVRVRRVAAPGDRR